jgi:hypothetical protein
MLATVGVGNHAARRWQHDAVHVIEWVRRVMEADDGYEPDPEKIVEVANVGPAIGGFLVGELRDAGIPALLAERHPTYGGVLRYTIACFEPDQARAVAIIDAALAKQRD